MELWNRRDGNMRKDELYKQYEQCISEFLCSISVEESSSNDIAQKERNLVSEIENEYMQATSELSRAKQTISAQYKSIWESCTANTGLLRPADQRPAYTDAGWRECVREQAQIAKQIQEWFSVKTQEAVAEKQRRMKLEAERKAADALAAAEAERKRKEEEAALEAAKGASLLDEIKRRFRKKL